MKLRGRLAWYGLAVIASFAAALRITEPGLGLARLIAPVAIAAAVAAALAWLIARDFNSALARLREAMRELTAGNLDARPPIGGPAEVAGLAEATHRVAEQLGNRLSALEADDALLAALVESLNEAVIAVDSRERVVRINEAARKLLSAREPVPFSTGKLPRSRVLQQALRDGLRGTPTGPVEVEVSGRQLSVTSRPLAGGGAVLAALDLTPLKRLEAVRRDFVANVSHELRTPLTVVRGFAETLAAGDVPDDQRREFSEMIRSNTERMQRIVDDLLDLSRIESGGWVPNPTPVELQPIADEVLAHVATRAREKGLAMAVDIAPAAERIHADRVAVIQTLTNMVENAVRHTATGTVTIFAEPSETGVWVGVRDTGQGIPHDHLSRIFERFYRADPGRSRESGGTGLGLAIVKHLVEAHGGEVGADSDVGRGTTVRAFFPSPEPDDVTRA